MVEKDSFESKTPKGQNTTDTKSGPFGRPAEHSSSSSQSSGSCSSSSTEQSIDEPMVEQLIDEPSEPNLQPAIAQVTTDDHNKAQDYETATAGPKKDTETGQPGDGDDIKLALILENVSGQQEVLKDPSKRITSDNREREQDLIAQYEKLNITALTSSSSLEEEQNV